MQSGKPVGVFRTHADAPRVLIANSNLVPHWATWEHFNELDRKGLMMYGQMTAGSWIYIGSQGIVQGTYETFVEMGRQHYGGSLKGRWILTAGPRRHGRRAAAGGDDGRRLDAGGRMPAVAASSSACARGYLDVAAKDLDEALALIERARQRGQAGLRRPARQRGRGAAGAAARAASGPTSSPTRPPRTTRSTAICRPAGPSSEWEARRAERPEGRRGARRAPRWPGTCEAMLAFQQPGVPTVDYGNNIRQMALDEGVADAFDFPGFVPAYIRPLFCRGIGPFRWAALSGDPEDIYRTDAKVKELIPDDPHLHHWLDMARRAHQVPGPAGAHLLGRPRRPPPRSAWRSTRWWRAAS